MRARAGRGLSDTSEAPMHVTEQGLDALEMPSALAQWVDRLPKDLLQIIDTIEGETGGRAWLVGGCIRDCLCGLTPWEVDMATTLRPEQVLALFPRALDTGSSHGTVTVRKGGVSCEVTTLRAEAEHGLDGSFALSAGSVEASGVRFGTSLKHDLEQRDLTINSMAVHVASRHLFDPAGGRHDIETKTLRAVGNAQQRLSEDALRALRAYRFIDSKSGLWEPDVELSKALQIAVASPLLNEISRERIWAELRRILQGPRADVVLGRMAADGVLRVVLHHDISADSIGVRALGSLSPKDLPLWSSNPSLLQALSPPACEEKKSDIGRDVLLRARAPAKEQIFSHLAVVDLEATCDDRRGFAPAEIIELPVVLIHCATGEVVSEFHTFVRPVVNPSLTDFCKELTGITQQQVDAAPEFREALTDLQEWLHKHGFATDMMTRNGSTEIGTTSESLLWVCDGDWDLRSMIPRQCMLSDVEQPAFLHRWLDIRTAFEDQLNLPSKTLVSMCQALDIPFVGKAHSGIDDARNIARCALVLMQEHGAVFEPSSHIKALEPSAGAHKSGRSVSLLSSAPRQGGHEERCQETVCARMSLLLAQLQDEEAEVALKRLKVSKSEIRMALMYKRLLGNLPDAALPGELRRYRAVLGTHLMQMHLNLERAWAKVEAGPDADLLTTRGSDSLNRVREVEEALKELPPLQSPLGAEALITGDWLVEEGGLPPGKLLGRVKDYLHHCQIDRDVPSILDMQQLFQQHQDEWKAMDRRLLDSYLEQLPRLQWPP